MVYTGYMDNSEMTLKQAMDFLGIKSKITLRKYADTGVIPSRRARTSSGEWRMFKKTDLVSFKSRMNKNRSNGFSYLPLEIQEAPKKRAPKPK